LSGVDLTGPLLSLTREDPVSIQIKDLFFNFTLLLFDFIPQNISDTLIPLDGQNCKSKFFKRDFQKVSNLQPRLIVFVN
jgi:hypothetical protein